MAGRIATGDSRRLGPALRRTRARRRGRGARPGVTGFNSLLENERRVTTEASHQLRTPLTALSLRLEEILADRRPRRRARGGHRRAGPGRAALRRRRRGRRRQPRQPAVRARADRHRRRSSRRQVTEWTPAFHAARRRIVRIGTHGARRGGAAGRAGAGARHAHRELARPRRGRHDDPAARLRPVGRHRGLRRGAGRPATSSTSTVFDRSVSGADSSGLGLALARTLVAADGGRLEMLGGASGRVRDVPAGPASPRRSRDGVGQQPTVPGSAGVRSRRSDGGGERLVAGGLGVRREHPAAVGPEAEQRAERRGRRRWR